MTTTKNPAASTRVSGVSAREQIRRNWPYEVVFLGLVAVAALVVLSPVLRRSGWPLNEGSTGPLLLVQIYAAHFRHHDFFPVWSSTDAFGLGSPILLYYHRTFFYVAGMLLAVTGISLKSAVVVTLALFMGVGAYGMRLAIGVVTDSRFLCVVGSLGFLFTNYAFSDWLDPKGDLAEFSALMLVPWLLYCCLRLVTDRHASLLFVPVVVLVVFTHTAIALLSLIALGMALVTIAVVAGWSGLRTIAPRVAVIALATAVLLTPLLLAAYRFARFYDPQTKNTAFGQLSTSQFVGFGYYFYDGSHRWFVPPKGHAFVQIDYAIWVPLVCALGAVVVYGVVRAARGTGRVLSCPTVPPATLFLLASFAAYLFLQMRISAFVYRLVHPLQIISYPWRMMAFLTPIGILLVAVVADRGMHRFHLRRELWWALGAGWLGSMVLLSPIFSSVSAPLAAPNQFTVMGAFIPPAHIDYNKFHGFFMGAWVGEIYPEFLPKVLGPDGREVSNDHPLYQQIKERNGGGASLSKVPCTVVGPSDADFESSELTFAVTCRGRTRLALPVSVNPASTVFVSVAGGRPHQVPYSSIVTDPRMVISVATSRPETVVVHLPDLWRVLF